MGRDDEDDTVQTPPPRRSLDESEAMRKLASFEANWRLDHENLERLARRVDELEISNAHYERQLRSRSRLIYSLRRKLAEWVGHDPSGGDSALRRAVLEWIKDSDDSEN